MRAVIVPTFQMGPAIPEVWNDLPLGEQGYVPPETVARAGLAMHDRRHWDPGLLPPALVCPLSLPMRPVLVSFSGNISFPFPAPPDLALLPLFLG